MALSPLQLSVLCRLSLALFFTSLLFFNDLFSTVIAARTCRHDNHTAANQSGLAGETVCAWTHLLCYSQMLFTLGLLLGSLVGGAIADRYGKRPVLLVCIFLHAGCSIIPAVLPHLLLFLTIRCLTGVCSCCINVCAFSLAVEWIGPQSRLWPASFLSFCFSLGTMGGALLAWISPTWTHLHLSVALPQIICLPVYLSLPESPCWLLLRRRMGVLDGYRGNSTADKLCVDQLLQKDDEQLSNAGHAPSDITNRSHPIIILRVFIMSYLNAASALTYFGICLNIGSFGVDVYSAQFFSGLSEAPCLLVPLVPLGRRPISMLSQLLSGAACFLSLLLSRNNVHPALVMSFALLGKFCVLTSSFICSVYCVELFPTAIRQRCFSLVNLCYRLGCLASTLVPSSHSGAISLAAMVAYSSGPIIGCGLCLLLPETSGVPLPDSLPLKPHPQEQCTLKEKLDET
ncbi:solute carrier family 22 member 13 [Gouania willdenowi]|uniref:Solute carrier family 22 member 13-like n=1 Tax=Gouania willdenowi TaxID=441366 RepID=A0A8C5DFF7_GOUWI|nr:solute carrier family 22 member 13-like [Gouania willdenowi]